VFVPRVFGVRYNKGVWYTVAETARLLNCSPRRVYYLIQRGRLPTIGERPYIIAESAINALQADPKRQKALARQRRIFTTGTRESAKPQDWTRQKSTIPNPKT